MHVIRNLPRALTAVAVAALCVSSIANAALFRSYLSLTGSDANPCTLQAPCRLLPAALAAVNDGGEIWMLDSANYNTAPVSITKSVKILAIPGQMGSVVGSSGDAIVINTSGDVTLRNLQVLNFNAGVNGVNIQNAGAVHIEKTSIDGFRSDAGSCIRLDSPNTVRLYVDDSFLRQCRNGVFANGAATANRTSVLIDNTRIERGFNQASTVSNGVWMQGAVDVTLRNSTISRMDAGVRFENPTGGASHLEINHSQITRSTTGVIYSNSVASGVGQISIIGSEVTNIGEGINVANSAAGGNVTLVVASSHLAYSAGNGVTLANSAPDANTRIFMELIHSQVTNFSAVAIDLRAGNGSKTYLVSRDSQIMHAGTGVKTSGASPVSVSLIRSGIHNLTTAIDHGSGIVRLDGNHVVKCANDFVNSGSGNIVSLGNNMVVENDNASGFTYITPTIIPAK
jgi:hypothetical protein